MQERAERWASTMRGHAADGIALAHEDSWAGPGSSGTLERRAREHDEHYQLAPHATKAFGAGDRVGLEILRGGVTVEIQGTLGTL